MARHTRRDFIVHLGGSVAAVGLTAACAPPRPPVSKPAPPEVAATPPGQTRRIATLIYGNVTGIDSTDPYPNNNPSNQFRGQVFNTLVNLDAKLQPVPELAESWSLSDDHVTLTLKLRQDVVFHRGRKFTADDAKWNLEYAQDARSKAQAGSELAGVRVEATDAHTLRLTLPGYLPHIFSLLLNVVIIDPQSNITRTAGGTGPFKVDFLQPGTEMHLVRNAAYWRGAQVHVDAVTIKTVPDPASLLVWLDSGAVHIAFPLPSNEVNRLQTGSNTSVAIFPGAGNHCYLVSAADPPLSNRMVRQALAAAIDRTRYASVMMHGLADANSLVFPRESPVWDGALDTVEFNLELARQLLEEAGQSGGFSTTVQGSRGIPELLLFNQVLKADLANIGVAATVSEIDENVRVAMVAEGTFSGLLAHAYGNADLDPARLFSLYPFRPDNNSSRFQSQEYARLIKVARAEQDSQRRIAIYRDITRLLRDEAFVLPVATPQVAFGVRRGVRGLTVTPGQPSAPYFEGVTLA